MVKTAGSNLLDPLSDAESGSASSSSSGSDVLPETRDSLRQRELQQKYGSAGSDMSSAPDSSKQDELQDRYSNPGSDQPVKKRPRLRNRLPSKWVLAIFGGGGIGFIGIVVFIIFLLSLLQVPTLAKNITNYEFANLTRQTARAINTTTEQGLALQAAQDNVWTKLKEKYQGLRDNTWGKLDGLRPNQVAKNLHEDGTLSINTEAHGLLGRTVVKDIVINGKSFAIPPEVTGDISLFGRDLHVPIISDLIYLKNLKGNLGAKLAFKRDFNAALNQALDEASVGPWMRSILGFKFRSQLGLGLVGFVPDRFIGKTPKQADVEYTQEKAIASQEAATAADNAASAAVQDGTNAAEEAEKAVISNPTAVEEAIQNKGVAPSIVRAIATAGTNKWVATAIGVANPIYDVAMPVCIIYDGSVQQSGPSIDNNTNRERSEAVRLIATADQQAAGPRNLEDSIGFGAGIQAANDTYGNSSTSIVMRRASGQQVDTSGQTSAEAGAGGSYYYDIFNFLGMNSHSGGGALIQTITSGTCNALTNTTTAALLGLANIVVAVATWGTSDAAEEAVAEGAGQAIKKIAVDSFKHIFFKRVEETATGTVETTFLSRLGRFIWKQKVLAGAIVIGDIVNAMTAVRSGAAFDGLVQQDEAIDEADAGANIIDGDFQRNMNFAPPLTTAQTSQRDAADATYVASLNASKPFAERYLALDNPDSLLVRAAMAVNSWRSLRLVQVIPNLMSSVVSVPSNVLTALHVFGIAGAAPDPLTQHYGNVQFAWPEDQDKLMDTDPSYLPLDNQEVLDQSGKEDEIAQKYAVCFGYDYNSSGTGLDPTDPNSRMQLNMHGNGSMGNLLASGMIPRDDNGAVIADDGNIDHCTPRNLGCSNPQYGDLVCRWRYAMRYLSAINLVTNMQAVTQQ